MRSMQQWVVVMSYPVRVFNVVKHDVKNKILDTLVNRFYTRSTEDDYTKNMAYPHV